MEISKDRLMLIAGIWLVIPAIGVVYFIFKSRKDKEIAEGTYYANKRKRTHNMHSMLIKNAITRGPYKRIVENFSTMACYDMDTIREKSVNLFMTSVGVGIAMPILSLILMKDVLISVLVFFVGYIYYNVNINKALDTAYVNIMRELSISIQSIRERYMEYHSVPLAVLYADKGTLLEKPLTTIYEILTDTNGRDMLDEFSRTSPIRLIKTLAMTCWVVYESGDELNDKGGSSFSDELTALRQEIDTEIVRLEKQRIKFKSLSTLSLIGLICMPICEMYLLGQIPGTSVLIKGVYGEFSKAAITIGTIIAYYVISVINRPTIVNQIDKVGWIDSLTGNRDIMKYIKNIIPRNFKTVQSWNQRLKGAISSKSLEYIYLSKVIFATVAFCATLAFCIGFTVTSKSYLYHNTGSLSFIPSAGMTDRQQLVLPELDAEYLAAVPELEEEEALRLVKSKLRGMSDMEALEQVDRLQMKYRRYHGLGFKWWYVLLAWVGAVIGWFVPEISLMLRTTLVNSEALEDVMQLQTMMIVLSNTKIDVYGCLYWLEKNSTIHKAALRCAYHEYSSDPLGALENLKDKVGIVEFKRLVSKLQSAVYNLSLKDAFSDMILDKEQSLAIRKELQQEALESKAEWAKMIAVVPAALTICLMFIGPILILGVQELMEAFTNLGSM